ncbi:MAG: ABC transporter substrate-binding protein [Spirochaetales bacterium]|nr:ABC transporter substrate-binding protein [Spirochaetales bacterium]
MVIKSTLKRKSLFISPSTFLGVVIMIALSTFPCLADSTTLPQSSPRVVFLNPGEPVDRGKGMFWPLTARLMGVAANTFGIQLEVLYAERDHLLMLRQAESLSKRRDLPDYVVMVNEKQAAPQMLQMFAGTSTKVVLIHNDLTLEQRREFGNERGQMSHWIGTVTTDEESGTYRMMDELYRQLGTREPQVIGITGERGTPVSLERAQGVSDYMSESGRGRQLQLAFSNWGAADAESKADVLLARYPQANIIWAANYSMALGALRAVEAQGAPVLVGSTAVAPYSMANIAKEGMAVSLGSHFFIGAWAMVLLHDYHHGLDFEARGGVRQRLDYLSVINSENASRYYQVIYEESDTIDFSIFSKYLHPSPGSYSFSLAPLMADK